MAIGKKLVSIIVPIYSEEKTIPEFYSRTKSALNTISSEIDYELLFVNDGSKDQSIERLTELHEKDPTVKIINFSRNFGHQIAITAGIDHANGDAVVIIDGDLQDPPEVILEMIEKWKQGYKVVYGLRTRRKGESAFKLVTAKMFYRILAKFSDIQIPLDTGDFRLMDRAVVDSLKSLREENRYIRGLVSWVGFPQCGLPYERDVRYAGETKFPLKKMLRFAINGITSFSEKPLNFAGYLGMLITFISSLLALYILFSKISNPAASIRGWTSLIIIVLFFGGVQLLSVGILGQYIGRIYREVKERPLYIIEKQYGFDKKITSQPR